MAYGFINSWTRPIMYWLINKPLASTAPNSGKATLEKLMFPVQRGAKHSFYFGGIFSLYRNNMENTGVGEKILKMYIR